METRIFNISSRTGIKNNGSMNSNITFFIPNFITSDDNTKNIYFSILKCEIPASFYLINDHNNTLAIQTNTGITTYVLEKGNYNINTFMTALKTLLGSNYTLSYNSITNKLTITYISNFTILAEQTTMERFLGITDEENTTSVNNSITSIYVCNFLQQQRLHLRSNELSLDTYNAYDKSTDCFLSLQNTSSNLGVIFYNNDYNFRYLLEIEQLDTLTIRITDDKNREMDFQNVDWFMSLQIDYEYYETPVKSNLNKFFKLYRKNIALEYLQSLVN